MIKKQVCRTVGGMRWTLDMDEDLGEVNLDWVAFVEAADVETGDVVACGPYMQVLGFQEIPLANQEGAERPGVLPLPAEVSKWMSKYADTIREALGRLIRARRKPRKTVAM